MLSRVADAIYWMTRYLERAENISRFIDVNWRLQLDLASDSSNQWKPLISVTGDKELFHSFYQTPDQESVIFFLTFDHAYPNSILACVRNARENARTVREHISSELWEQLNIFYHDVETAARKPKPVLENPSSFCDRVKTGVTLLGGLIYNTMSHGEAFHFSRVGKFLERADKTSRILDVKYFILLPDLNYVGTAYDDIQWAALLRSVSAFQEYRRKFGRVTPAAVVEFLLMDPVFPRSALYCLLRTQDSLRFISSGSKGFFANPAEQQLGRLCADLMYSDMEEIVTSGLHEFLDRLQQRMNLVDSAIASTFFSPPAPIDAAQQQ